MTGERGVRAPRPVNGSWGVAACLTALHTRSEH
jgi:hypothetical protein